VVANRVFTLGLADIEKEVANTDGKLRPMEIEVAGTVFLVGTSRRDKALFLNWWASTDLHNIVWTRFLFFSLTRRPVRKVECFTYAKES